MHCAGVAVASSLMPATLLAENRFGGLRTGLGSRRRAVRILLTAVRDELVWIDCEMTGLDLKADRLIEIAVLVTDGELNLLGDGLDVVIHADDEALSRSEERRVGKECRTRGWAE